MEETYKFGKIVFMLPYSINVKDPKGIIYERYDNYTKSLEDLNKEKKFRESYNDKFIYFKLVDNIIKKKYYPQIDILGEFNPGKDYLIDNYSKFNLYEVKALYDYFPEIRITYFLNILSEVDKIIESINIEDLINKIKVEVKTKHYSKPGGDDSFKVNIEFNTDDLIKNIFFKKYLKFLLPNYNLQTFNESGYSDSIIFSNEYFANQHDLDKLKANEKEIELVNNFKEKYSREEHKISIIQELVDLFPIQFGN